MKQLLILFFIALLMIPEASAQEWANFGRFAEDNAALGAPADGERRVAFMGDSITEGWSELYPDFFEDQPFINRGIGGQVTAQMLLRFREDVLDLNPSIVFILAGTNDIALNQGPIPLETVAGHIESMAELAWANGVDPVICSVLPASHYPWREGVDPSTEIPKLNAMLQAYAQKMGFRYLDYFGAMTDGNNGLQADLTSDAVHLTEAGYARLSELATAMLTTFEPK
ncbi:MAG: GDSL-type esterase/lipase family protein [Bacteroidetes bacterium]|nr:GDSL-type esterase/lipase family protein [Bacteroidota bacterium]